VVNLVGRLGLDMKMIRGLELDLIKLRSIKNRVKKLQAAEDLVIKYPEDPQAHLELAYCMSSLEAKIRKMNLT